MGFFIIVTEFTSLASVVVVYGGLRVCGMRGNRVYGFMYGDCVGKWVEYRGVGV